MSAKPTVALLSLGCPKNLVDSQAMLGLLEQAGYEIVEELEQGEVVIVNTCAFIEPAQEEAVEALLDLAELKRGKCRALICAGCLPQRHGEALAAELPEVDVFLGVGAVPRIVEAVEAALRGERAVLEAPLGWVYDGSTPRVHTGPQWLAYLKIADGCDHRCAFCTIPQIRGRYRSVPMEALGAQLAGLAEAGVAEVCLIAQDTSAYGHDLRPRRRLAELLERLAQVSFGGWLRLLYLHPTSLSEAAISRICAGPPFVPYFDIPLQHASRRVLRAMGRKGDAESYLELVRAIRERALEAAIRSTFIVGYPGESEADFEELLEFLRLARLDRVSCFPYWPEAGTPAAELGEQVPLELRDERLDELMQVQEQVSLERNQELVGREMTVLVEGRVTGSRLWYGRSYRDAPEIDGQVKLAHPEGGAEPRPGQFVTAQIQRAEVHDLQGMLVQV